MHYETKNSCPLCDGTTVRKPFFRIHKCVCCDWKGYGVNNKNNETAVYTEEDKTEVEMFDFGSDYAQTYTETCECGEKVEVSTQQDNSQGNYTEIYIKCSCGKSVKFVLPAN